VFANTVGMRAYRQWRTSRDLFTGPNVLIKKKGAKAMVEPGPFHWTVR